jgi:hypothetical protein
VSALDDRFRLRGDVLVELYNRAVAGRGPLESAGRYLVGLATYPLFDSVLSIKPRRPGAGPRRVRDLFAGLFAFEIANCAAKAAGRKGGNAVVAQFESGRF